MSHNSIHTGLAWLLVILGLCVRAMGAEPATRPATTRAAVQRVVVVVDASGSMVACQGAAAKAVKNVLERLKAEQPFTVWGVSSLGVQKLGPAMLPLDQTAKRHASEFLGNLELAGQDGMAKYIGATDTVRPTHVWIVTDTANGSTRERRAAIAVLKRLRATVTMVFVTDGVGSEVYSDAGFTCVDGNLQAIAGR